VAVLVAYHLAGRDIALMSVAAVVIGHNFPIFLRFRGGKGVATSFGAVIAIEPFVACACLVIWIVTMLVWRYSSLGALVSFAALIPAGIILAVDEKFAALSVFLSLMIFIKHRSNIGRLIKGTEPKVGRKTAEVQ
jgi:glycerol-3-phosphate acyltransferase PlsY